MFWKKKKDSKAKKASSADDNRKMMEAMYARNAAGEGDGPVVVDEDQHDDDYASDASDASSGSGRGSHSNSNAATPVAAAPLTANTSTASTSSRRTIASGKVDAKFSYLPYSSLAPEIKKGKFETKKDLARAKDAEKAAKSLVAQVYAQKGSDLHVDDTIVLYSSKEEKDDIFRGSGEQSGIEVYRIVGMNPQPVLKHLWGQFFAGDCYIVLKTNDAQDEDERMRKMHMWMGKNATNTKRAVCAYLAYELNNRLSNKGLRMATMLLEEQGDESRDFMNFFQNKFEYLDKGSPEAPLRAVDRPAPEIRLLKIVQEGRVFAKRVPLRPLSALERDAVYVLVTPDAIYVYMGVDASEPVRIKGIDVAAMVKHEEISPRDPRLLISRLRPGPSEMMHCPIKLVVQDSADEAEFEMVKYLPAGIKATSDDAAGDVAILHRLVEATNGDESGASVELTTVADRPLKRETLEQTACYILETRNDLFVWYGMRTTVLERRFASALADLVASSAGTSAPKVHKFFADGEPVLFKERFASGFYPVETPETFAQRQKLYLSNICRMTITGDMPSYFDEWEDDSTLEKKKKKDLKVIDEMDDGSGNVTMWRVVDSRTAVEVPKNQLGQFYSGECYLVLYEFNRNMIRYVADDDVSEAESYIPSDSEDEEDDRSESDAGSEPYASDDEIDTVEKKLAMLRANKTILQAEKEDLEPTKSFEQQIREAEEKRKAEMAAKMKQLEAGLEEIDTRNKFPEKDKNAKKKKIFYLTRKILYCWEGSAADTRVSSRIIKENWQGLATDHINPAKVITLEEGKETDHFLRIFEHMMVTHIGKQPSEEQKRQLAASSAKRQAEDQMRLYRIYCKSVINSRAIEVPKATASLNSNDVFVLVGQHTAWVWCGLHASNTKKQIALKFGEVLCAGREVTAIEEGLVPEEFFEDLADLDDTYVREKLRYSQGIVWECAVTNEGKHRIMEVGEVGKNYLQDDLLICHTTLIFDFGTTLFIWYSRDPSSAERELAKHAAEAMTAEEEDDEGDEEEEEYDEEEDEPPKKTQGNSSSNIKIIEIYRGKEPMAFKQSFPQWKEDRKFVDVFVEQAQRRVDAYRTMVKRCLPMLQTVRQKHRNLLSNDEYVNMHNVVESVLLVKKTQKNFQLLVTALEQCGLEFQDSGESFAYAADLLKFYVQEFAADEERERREEEERKKQKAAIIVK